VTAGIPADLARLQAANARLKAILEQHGIAWDVPLPPVSPVSVLDDTPADPTTPLASAEKIALFRRLFRGRADVYPQRWESQKGASGYGVSNY